MTTGLADTISTNSIAASNRPGRLSISLTIASFQVPLFNLLSFGNESFFDGHLPSVMMLTFSCSFMAIQLVYFCRNKPISNKEIMVYTLSLLCTVVVTALMYQLQHTRGGENIKTFVINVLGLVNSGVAVIFKMFVEFKRLRNSPPLLEQHDMNHIIV